MRLEDQVANLELSKRLDELGVKIDSYFYWYKNPNSNEFKIFHHHRFELVQGSENYEFYPAYTVAELGIIIPHILQSKNTTQSDSHFETFKNENNQWIVTYVLKHSMPPVIAILGDTEANARAKMLIWLIENGYVKVEELNGK